MWGIRTGEIGKVFLIARVVPHITELCSAVQ